MPVVRLVAEPISSRLGKAGAGGPARVSGLLKSKATLDAPLEPDA